MPDRASVESNDDLCIKEHWNTGHWQKAKPIIWVDIHCGRNSSDSHVRTFMEDLSEHLSEAEVTAG